MDDYSIYLHIPFCRHRCGYCDFNTYAGLEKAIPAYIDALCHEIRAVGESVSQPLPVHTVFFGGGTPSLISADELRSVIHTLKENYLFAPDAEITLEANPGTVSLMYLRALREIGFNRISFGMQSANQEELRFLERQHDHVDVIHAVQWARQAGFDNLSLDLIFGLPGQTLNQWQQSMERALELQPEHLSLYALTVEDGTPLGKWASKGLVEMPDDDLAADMYEWAGERLAHAGFEQYEISNWDAVKQDGRCLACRHNLQYWHNKPYLGFGAGAHGSAAGYRMENVKGVRAYIQRCFNTAPAAFPIGPAVESYQQITTKTAMQETMMVGLRLTEAGVSDRAFYDRFHSRLMDIFPSEIKSLCALGLLEWVGIKDDRLRLTPHGRLLGNQVFMQFVGIEE